MGGDGVKDGRLFVGGHVSADVKVVDCGLSSGINFFSLDDFDSKVLEGFGNGTSLAFHDYNS